jgi:CheY-like chemotaxis protein
LMSVSKRILVVDDNEPSALTLTWALEMFGHEVRTCYDGASAVTMAGAFAPQVVLLDLGMPNMDGYETCRQMRLGSSAITPRIVAQTGWGDAATRQKTADAGFDYHFTKPVDLDALARLIESYG